MAIIKPFKAIRPTKGKVSFVASRSYQEYSCREIKNFLNRLSQRQAIGVYLDYARYRFRRFYFGKAQYKHFGLRTKNRNFIVYPTQNCEKAIPTSPKARCNQKPRGRAVGELFRLSAVLEFNPFSFLHIINTSYKYVKNVSGQERFKFAHDRYLNEFGTTGYEIGINISNNSCL